MIRPPVARLTLVGGDDLDLGPGRPLHELRDPALVPCRVVAPGDRLASRLEELQQSLVAEEAHLDGLAEGGPSLALGQAAKDARCR